MTEPTLLRKHAERIWRAGVDAADSRGLVESALRLTGQTLAVGDDCSIDLSTIQCICVVGAGKAGAGMVAGIESVLGEPFGDRLSGWVNVPADCARQGEHITLHPARPAGVNEPTEAGVHGAEEIVGRLHALAPNDLCVVLISGGGSALMPLPRTGISLADKAAVTRLLMHSGATIGELNCVRRHLSQLKGGGLVRATRAGRILTLIISDVVGDPLDVIASGPTVEDSSTPADALAILEPFADRVPASVLGVLRSSGPPEVAGDFERVSNVVIGNNRTALSACASAATAAGYRVLDLGSDNTGDAAATGRQLLELARRIRDQSDPIAPPACVLSGGEPTVQLVQTDRPQKGGRNQELALAALVESAGDLERIAVLSGGTDGEDGPTDAAGAVVTAAVHRRADELGLDAGAFLEVNNSYPFLDQTGALLRTGPTHTNVMDVRVVLVH